MKNKGKYYKYARPGDTAIILCTEDSEEYLFSGVCIRKGTKVKHDVGYFSTHWSSELFEEIQYNDKSVEEKINDELLESKKKLITFDEESTKFKCAQSRIHLLEKLKG